MSSDFRHTLGFEQLQIQKPKTAEETVKIVSTIIDELNRTHGKLQDSFKRLEGSSGGGATTVIIGSGTSSSGSSSVATDFRANSIAVVSGSNVITFSTPMTKDYVIIPIYVTAIAIEFIDPTQIVYTMNGFTVTVDSAGTLIYAILPKS